MRGKLIGLTMFMLVSALAQTSAVGAFDPNTDPSLVGWWKLDETSGTAAADSSGKGNTGTLNGNPVWAAGKIAGGLQFDGTGDYVDCGNKPSVNITGEVTITAWIKVPVLGRDHKIANNQNNSTGGYKFCVYSDNRVEFEVRSSSNAATLNRTSAGGTFLTTDVWYFVAGVYSLSGGYIRTYVSGKLDRELVTSAVLGASNGPFGIGANWSTGGSTFQGTMDDVHLFNRALSAAEIKTMMPPQLKAYGPTPTDGQTGVAAPLLQWLSGETASWHDIYFGTSPTLGPADKMMRVQLAMTVYWHLPGITPGTTYYWRIDEVEANGTTIHKGDVWSFTAAPLTAYNPSPLNGARWLAVDTQLTWTAGAGAQSHDVYFGTNKADVEAGTGGTFKLNQFGTTYVPTGLADKTTYYWRIDEKASGGVINKGAVWSFTTIGPGGGLKGQYFNNMNLQGTPVLTRTDSTVNFSWGAAAPNAAVPVDNFSVRWTGELEVAFTEKYTFVNRTDDGGRVWVNNQLVVNDWSDHGARDVTGTIDLVGGQTYPIVMEMYENGGDAVAILSWQSASTPRQVIPAGALQLPVRASAPRPATGAVNVTQTPKLTWTAGDKATTHNVYFGTDQAAVANATPATAGIYKGTQNLAATSYLPGTLEWNTTYYWKIDEVNATNPDSPWKGNVWSFTTADFFIVEDFEDYNDFGNRIFQTWIDGYGYSDPAPGNPGNGTGSTVGNLTAPFAETRAAYRHDGAQAMPMDYNDAKLPYYSEAERSWTTGQDWTINGVKALAVWFRGIAGSTGGITYDQAADTYTIKGSGSDIWGTSDQFHYAYKTLSGDGSIIGRIDSVDNTNAWAKVGFMIRETLDANSPLADAAITPSGRVAFQWRTAKGANMGSPDSSTATVTNAITLPRWIKLTRAGNTFTVQHSADGVNWIDIVPETAADPLSMTVQMNPTVYIGLMVTSHDAALTCTAKVSKVSVTGTVPAGRFTTSRDIGIRSNAMEPLYVAVTDTAGKSKVVTHSEPNAVQKTTYQEWNIPLKTFSDAGVNLKSIKKIAVGTGNKAAPTPGGTGSLYFDDIRLYKPRCVPAMGKPAADINSDCAVDYKDLDLMADQWLRTAPPALSADLTTDSKVDLKDFAKLGQGWLEETLWP